ncbi:TolC family protein [Riemerella anatipestifer]|uniref:TolC family protein n=1 Tax=Riemerella anatipestifer TaxID=34085 RepID=UPI00129E973E|nr:TolC family protein [Riemerella anatipestifer]MRM97250.1 TolC family protein [Riemerella anatipestifer]MRN00511.1 TolC family protein [Riemerella anatipestifer]MRN02680.1 TolC family protein [Riemerella anatipestifer]
MKLNIKFVLLSSVFFGGIANAQTKISLDEAYQKALEHNLTLKNAELRSKYQEKIKKSFLTIDPLNVSGEYGQINSSYKDNRFSVSQGFRLPGVYQKQKQLLLEEWKTSVMLSSLEKWQLKREISLIYNQLCYLDEKEALLKKIEQIYQQYFSRVNLRLQKGESNILEKTTAENFKAQAEIQVNNIKRDREITQKQLSFLINDGQVYTNDSQALSMMSIANLSEESQLQNNRVLEIMNQQKNVEMARLATEKSKLLPSFNIGYNTMTMYGMGADNLLYDHSTRFHSVVVGVSIPIFNSAQKSIISGQKINQEIAENQWKLGLNNLKRQYVELSNAYNKLKDEINYYQSKGLENSETIIKTANRQLYEGQINYLEWSLLMNQALDIQNMYIDKLKEINDRAIEINALLDNSQY